MKYQAAALALLLHGSTVLAGVQRRDGSDRRWGQCAGQKYNGPTDCPSGWTCQLQNPYYSQCLEGGSGGSTSGSGSVSGGYSNSTGSTSTGSIGSGPGTGSGTGSKLGVGVSSPVPSTSSLPSGVTSFGAVGSTGTDAGDDGDDDGEGTCDAKDEEDDTTTSTKTTPAVAPAGKLAAGVVTNPSGTAGSGGSATTSASGAGATGGSTKTDMTGSDTTGSDTSGSDTTGSDTTGSDTTGSDTTGSDTTGSDTTGSNSTESNTSGGSTGGGGALATTTQYGPLTGSSPGACGCAGSWQNGDTTSSSDNSSMITTAAGGPSILDSYCGAGCGACYLLTSTGKPPCSDDACKVSPSSAGQTLTVMVTNECPTKGNEQWCSVPNKFGYEAHFDLAVQPQGWGNVVVEYKPTACPESLTGSWGECKCAGRSSPHEGTVPSGGKTSVS